MAASIDTGYVVDYHCPYCGEDDPHRIQSVRISTRETRKTIYVECGYCSSEFDIEVSSSLDPLWKASAW